MASAMCSHPPAAGRRVTIRDVARVAGVSPAVVSVVLNGASPRTAHVRVGAAARARVLAAAAQLNYRPNAAARALSGHSQLIGVILDKPAQHLGFEQHYVVEIQRALRTLGYQVLLDTADDEPVTLARALEECARYSVAGVLLVGWWARGDLLRAYGPPALAAAGSPPCVVIGTDVAGVGDAAVCRDNYGAARMAMAHLIALGHRRFLAMGLGLRRLAGCHDALVEAGLSVNAIEYWPPPLEPEQRGKEPDSSRSHGPSPDQPDWQFARGRWIVEQVFRDAVSGRTRFPQSSDSLPTAIVALNDEYAAGALSGLQALGLRVPEDVALVGCDNLPFGAYLSVPLTTIDWQVPVVVRHAIQHLMALIDRRRRGETWEYLREVVPAQLVVRRSCGAYLGHRG